MMAQTTAFWQKRRYFGLLWEWLFEILGSKALISLVAWLGSVF